MKTPRSHVASLRMRAKFCYRGTSLFCVNIAVLSEIERAIDSTDEGKERYQVLSGIMGRNAGKKESRRMLLVIGELALYRVYFSD